jgi:hypothetical protein
MHDHLIGPFWGNLIVISFAAAITVACFGAMFWLIFRPGETDRSHPKYDIFGEGSEP